jgi:hypothetical protein
VDEYDVDDLCIDFDKIEQARDAYRHHDAKTGAVMRATA